MTGGETKIFDPKDGFAPLTNVVEITDASVAKRGDRWWMYVAGEALGHEGIQLFSASLPAGAPLSAQGWTLDARSQRSRRALRRWPGMKPARRGT